MKTDEEVLILSPIPGQIYCGGETQVADDGEGRDGRAGCWRVVQSVLWPIGGICLSLRLLLAYCSSGGRISV